MPDMVIVAYRPHPGKAEQLQRLVERHVPFLRELGLATDRPGLAMRAADGTVVEVFEWETGAMESAHHHPRVQELWEQYSRVCDYVPLAQVPEAADLFSAFTPLATT